MIQKLRNNQLVKAMSVFLIQIILFELVFLPNHAYGQAGPNQTETSGFTLGSTSSLVDDFTGDFSYSIPLMDVDGYPITISYNSNVSMFQEASWVGLGWDLNVGSVSRDMRGIPDDFNGADEVQREVGMKDYAIADGKKNGGGLGVMYGGTKVGINVVYGTYMNSYNGKGTTWDFGIDVTNSENLIKFNWGVGFSMDSQNGVGRNNSVGLSDLTVSQQFSSRAGLQSTHVGLGMDVQVKNTSLSRNYSTTYSLGTQTSVPKFDLPRFGNNETETFDVNAMVEIGSVNLYVNYTNSQYEFDDKYIDKNTTVQIPAYGYFHLGKGQNATQSKRAMMDFNRERDTDFSEEMANLSFSAPTYDFFNVSAMGIGGSVRGQRNDIGTLQDPLINIQNVGENVNHNIYAGIAIPIGVTVGYAYAQGDVTADGQSGKWETSGSEFFKWSSVERNGIEKNVFFKAVGEQTPRDMSQWNSFGGSTPLQMNVGVSNDKIHGSSFFTLKSGGVVAGNSFVTTANAIPVRATYYKPVTGTEYASQSTYHGKIHYYDESDWINPTVLEENRINTLRKGHHVSALEATSVNGIQYYFDLPVYNIKQSDVTFNAAGLKDATTANQNLFAGEGLIEYTSNDNTTSNSRGRNNFFEKTTVPGYAHSYLLSLMTSSDYKDRTGDGPSTDDFGDYYKFNYTRIYNQATPYKWRFPYESNTAKLIQGHLSTPFDDVATYTYGEKEIWYTKSIETKNYIVEFHLNDDVSDQRKDGFGVSGENGGLNQNLSLRKLHKIVLYNRNDRLVNGANAVPLKTVTFEYDYSLCKGNPSNIETENGDFNKSGKLTLKAIHFSGGNSEEGTLAPYEFVYEAGGSFDNPDYSYIAIDRWGSFKENNAPYNNVEYPFAEQDETLANTYVQAWKLKSIRTPSNGGITVAYEADRFAYTQNKSVMRMFKVLGMTTESDFLANGFTYATNTLHSPTDKENPHQVVFFELDEPVTGTLQEKKEKIKNMYFRNQQGQPLQELFFQFRVKINPNISDSYENIVGFSGLIFNIGVVEHNGTQIGYVYFKEENVKDKEGSSNYKVNPVQKAAWQYARLNLPDVVYGNCNFNWSNPDVSDCDYSNDIDAAVAFGKDMNKQLHKKGYCEYFDAAHSFIRLYDPRGYKFGGNARVKSITYSDNWAEMTGTEEVNSSYKWEYIYENPQESTPSVYTGVAAYEPTLGNTVNPFYTWSAYKNEIKQFPDESLFNVEPVGELMYPAPIVGYSKVRVKFTDIENLTQNSVGSQTTSFYTAKDFPTTVVRTAIAKGGEVKKNNIFTSEQVRLFGFSQGYTVSTNDFHGKIKASEIRDANGSLIQESKYHYSNNNSVNTLNEKGELNQESIGIEYDIYADSRLVTNKAKTQTIGGGLTLTWYPPAGFSFMPRIIYSQGTTQTGFYTHTINKYLNRSAILEKVETTYLGSTNMAENLVRDRYSGEVIVSSLKDEYNDKLYSISYPAHWYYSNLQNKYINEHFALTNANINSGNLSFGASNQPDLVPGDVLEITNGTTTLGWALTGGNGGAIIQEDGSKFNTISQNYDVKLVASGRKNRITETMMQVTTKTNPLVGASFVFPSADVLSVSAVEYGFNHNISCFESHDKDFIERSTDHQITITADNKINPFTFGLAGNPRITKQMAIQTEREAITDGVRKDSEILDYYPLYAMDNNDKWYKIDQGAHPNNITPGDYRSWRELQRIATFDEYARAIEAKDPLDIHAGVLYGFNPQNKLLPIGQAINARTNQLAFESFEDHSYLSQETTPVTAHNHLNFLERDPDGVQVSSLNRHSGLFSLEINAEKSALVRRLISADSCSTSADRTSTGEYLVAECDCIKEFSPYPGEYVLSAWVKEQTAKPTYDDAKIKVELLSNTGSVVQTATLSPTGPVIDGWQRVEGKFNVLSVPNAYFVQFTLVNESTTEKMYVDDFRVHPFNSEMTTTVYNPTNLLPMATHDGYNFTTFYNYDENNQLVRIRVETVEGIKTISETSTGIRKRYTSN